MKDQNLTYGIQLAILYTIIWFTDLLDASSLNIALPAIAQSYSIDPTNVEWAVLGFLLSMTIGMCLSGWLGDRYGTRPIILISQILFLISSIGCGLAINIHMLVAFRILQGFAGGIAIPLGLSGLMKTLPQEYWARTTASMNMITLLAPAIGPIFGSYVTTFFGWRWIFFMKLPLCFISLFLSLIWLRKDECKPEIRFDLAGFIYASVTLIGILWIFSEVGRTNFVILLGITIVCAFSGYLFLKTERSSPCPLIPLDIFKIPEFSLGNLIQSAANTIFLGANFLISLYLQESLKLGLMETGWIMASITPGMILVQPLVGKFYNRLGALPFIIPGLIILSLCTWGFSMTTPATPPIVLALLVFLIGAASSMAQSANVNSIFSSLPHEYKRPGSSLYTLFKQISASFGVALTTMVLSLGAGYGAEAYHYCFLILGSIPAISLICCFYLIKVKTAKLNRA